MLTLWDHEDQQGQKGHKQECGMNKQWRCKSQEQEKIEKEEQEREGKVIRNGEKA